MALSGGSAGQDGEHALSLFQPITHPVLRRGGPVKAQFLRERERYEVEVAEKKKEIPSLTVASYKVSIDPGLLRRMHFLGKLKKVAPEKTFTQLTAEHVRNWVQSLVDKEESMFDPAVIEQALADLKVPMKIADPEARMLEYCSEFFSRLESLGYDNFKGVNLKKTVKLLQENLYPRNFKEVMQKALDYHEPIQSDVVEYVELLCEEAKAFEKYRQEEKKDNKAKAGKTYAGKNPAGKRGYENSPTTAGNSSNSKKSSRRDRPLCLNIECAKEGLRHYVLNECDRNSTEDAKKLLKEHKNKTVKKKDKEEVKKVSANEEKQDHNSTLIKAAFAKLVLRTVCADGGSDINFMPRDLLTDLTKQGAVLTVKTFDRPRRYGLAVSEDGKGEAIFVTCDKEVVLNVELFIRHGCYLELRNTTWYVAVSGVSEPLLGRSTLEALGINTKELLVAAVDRMGTSVDVSSIIPKEEYSKGSIARIIHNGLYHQDRGLSGDQCSTEEDSWLDLGQDAEPEVELAIQNTVQEAVNNGISTDGKVTLYSILRGYREVLRLRLGNDPPAKADPMIIKIVPGAKPIADKQRRYPPAGRKFMDRYVARIIEYGFGEVSTTATWTAAPVLVAKPPPAYFRLTFDYRPINLGFLFSGE